MAKESRKEELERVAKTYIQEYLCFSETLISTFIKGAEYADKHPVSPWIFVADKEPFEFEDIVISPKKSLATATTKDVIILTEDNQIRKDFMIYTKKYGWVWAGGKAPVCWMFIPEIPKV